MKHHILPPLSSQLVMFLLDITDLHVFVIVSKAVIVNDSY